MVKESSIEDRSVGKLRELYQEFEDLLKCTDPLFTQVNKVRMIAIVASMYILLENVTIEHTKNKFLNYCEHMKADIALYGTRKRVAGEMLCDKQKKAKAASKKIHSEISNLINL